MRKILLAVILLVPLGVGLAQGPASRVPVNMFMGEFVEVLIPVLGFETLLPPDLAQLPADQAFQIECALLVYRGLPAFGRANKDQLLTRGFLAEVVFELVRRRLGVVAYDPVEKIRLLAERKIMNPGDPAEIMSRDEVLAVLMNPLFAEAIVAFYSLPPYLGTGVTDQVKDPFGAYRVKNVTEDLSSKFSPEQ